MRRAAKVDGNQGAIVAALRQAGAVVQSLAEVGGGVPDLLAMHRGNIFLLEVKDPAGRGNRLTGPQETWHTTAWSQARVRVWVVQSPEEALKVIGVGQ